MTVEHVCAQTHDVFALSMPLDNTVRSYTRGTEKWTLRHTMPSFGGDPMKILSHPLRQSVLVRDRPSHDMKVSELDGGKWTDWRTLVSSDKEKTAYLAVMCFVEPNTVVLFDSNSKSLKKYELE